MLKKKIFLSVKKKSRFYAHRNAAALAETQHMKEKKKKKKKKNWGCWRRGNQNQFSPVPVLDSRCLARCPIFKTKYMLLNAQNVECVISIFSMGLEMWTNVKERKKNNQLMKKSPILKVLNWFQRELCTPFFNSIIVFCYKIFFFDILTVKHGEKLVI